MKLQLKAKHFQETSYIDNDNCAVSRAVKEQFNTEDVWTFSYKTLIEGKYFDIASGSGYLSGEFNRDKYKASQVNYDETIIRELELVEHVD
jgi:hypothetical protein